jgi:uncharacterized protein YegL
MNENLTEIAAILDRSGSMHNLTNDTVGGFNSFLKEQQEAPGEALLTTALFNNTYALLHDRADIKNIKAITNKDYIAQGSTALLDALGKAISQIGAKLHNTPEHERPGKVIFFIITDGEENASVEYTHDMIKEMVERQKNVYNWEFIFMGANIDSFSVGEKLGIAANRRFDYEAENGGMFLAQAAMSQAVLNFRRHSSVDEGEEFRDMIKKPKN